MNGKLKILTSMAIFGTVGIFVRFIPMVSAPIAFCRGVLGCVFLTSDSADQWSEEAQRRVRLFWNDEGVKIPGSVSILRSDSDLPDALVCGGDDGWRIAVYNFSDEIRDVSVDLSESGNCFADVHLCAMEGDADAAICGNVIRAAALPAHSVRIFEVK